MDETIQIRSIKKSDWNSTLQGFESDNIEQLLAVYGNNGEVIGTICESIDHKYYINGKPEVDYASLQAAAGALIKGES
jgi:hypothetical protein